MTESLIVEVAALAPDSGLVVARIPLHFTMFRDAFATGGHIGHKPPAISFCPLTAETGRDDART
jgi:hypothetical protein